MNLNTTFATLFDPPYFEKLLKPGSLAFHVHITKNVTHVEVIRCKQKKNPFALLAKEKS